MSGIGVEDGLVVAGLAVLGCALWWGAGWPGLAGFVGALLVVFGVALAWRNGNQA